MKIVIAGLTISSSWGNGHATLWRGLCRALARRGHRIVFFEKDVDYYARHRDMVELAGVDLVLYKDFQTIRSRLAEEFGAADAAILTSYCPDAISVSEVLLSSKAKIKCFYDLDTGVTLDTLESGRRPAYVSKRGFADFDLVLSFVGGTALADLRNKLGARRVVPLYGSVDPDVHFPVAGSAGRRFDLSYLGTYASDRQQQLTQLFLRPAERLPERAFILGGSMYPQDLAWRPNIFYQEHVAPPKHAQFYCSSRLTLNITRAGMARRGYCPSGRLFEAAACGVPLLSDCWEGLDQFFKPGQEIVIAQSADEAAAALELSDAELERISREARERTLAFHTADARAAELEHIFESALRPPLPSLARKSAEERIDLDAQSTRNVWGIVPAAGAGTRIQPLAFSKELLPVGSRIENGTERPRAVSEFVLERMVLGGATRICFVVSPGKDDIMTYYGGNFGRAHLCYVVQQRPAGLCDAVFQALPLIRDDDVVCLGLPDTIWFPEEGYRLLPDHLLSFLCFPVEHPEFFDAVVMDEHGSVREIQVKRSDATSNWIWGAFKMPGRVLHELYRLWIERERGDEFMGTLVNEYLARGGRALAVKAGEVYVDVGTVHGYREAVNRLARQQLAPSAA